MRDYPFLELAIVSIVVLSITLTAVLGFAAVLWHVDRAAALVGMLGLVCVSNALALGLFFIGRSGARKVRE